MIRVLAFVQGQEEPWGKNLYRATPARALGQEGRIMGVEEVAGFSSARKTCVAFLVIFILQPTEESIVPGSVRFNMMLRLLHSSTSVLFGFTGVVRWAR